MLGDVRTGALELIHKLATHMHYARLFTSFVFTDQPIEARKALRMHGTSISSTPSRRQTGQIRQMQRLRPCGSAASCDGVGGGHWNAEGRALWRGTAGRF